jgi:pyrimidine operon attenuation protein / uracil phosphoribosyltransferase
MQILNNQQVRQKIQRIAIEIVERNLDEPEVILVGLNNNGLGFAQLLLEALLPLVPPSMEIALTRIGLNPANPLEYVPFIEMPIEGLNNKAIILIDDVANTGRTIFYAIVPLLSVLPKKVEVAVLVDRTHKSFPIKADYIGLSLYTTLLENIEVKINDTEEMAVYLH